MVDLIDTLFARAKENGVPMAEICDRAGVHPTTPSRWRRKCNGATMKKLAALHAALTALIAERRMVA